MNTALTAPIPAMNKPEWLSMTDMMGDMGGMGGMSGMKHDGMQGMKSMQGMQGMQHGSMAMDHSQHAMPSMMQGGSLAIPSKQARHASTEYGPSTDARVDMARTNLDDLGVGLRNNGRKVLTLADLHTIRDAYIIKGVARGVDETQPDCFARAKLTMPII